MLKGLQDKDELVGKLKEEINLLYRVSAGQEYVPESRTRHGDRVAGRERAVDGISTREAFGTYHQSKISSWKWNSYSIHLVQTTRGFRW